MIKTILVPAPGDATDAATFAAALAVARPFASHIDAVHVRADPIELAVNTAADGGVGGVLVERLIDDLQREISDREAQAHRIYTEFCTGAGIKAAAVPADAPGEVSAWWHVETGRWPSSMTMYGTTADLIVASRGVPGNDATARSTLEAVLLETGRPVLVPAASKPQSGIPERVVIAWKPTPQAARAVAFAMPFVTRAKEVVIVTVDEDGAAQGDADRLAGYLTWHGVNPAVQRLSPGSNGAVETLVAAIGGKAGLLVMGGYGHARVREWVFGGFTHRILTDCPVPVLLAH